MFVNNKLEIFEQLWGLYFHKQPQKQKYVHVRTKYIKSTLRVLIKAEKCI